MPKIKRTTTDTFNYSANSSEIATIFAMNKQNIPLIGGEATFAGAISVEQTQHGVHPWRLPYKKRNLFEPGLITQAAMPAGVRLTLVSDTSCLNLSASANGPANALPENSDEKAHYDLLVDGEFHSRVKATFKEMRNIRFENLPEGEHCLELYLPQSADVIINSASVDSGASIKKWDDKRPRWTVYGSSITHCRRSYGPSETWPALVAQNFDLNMTCLGYGGNCHMEPMVAKIIRDTPADYISFCLGINTYGGTLAERTFRAAVIGLIQTVREGHPDTPIVCVSPICSPPREDGPGSTGMTLNLMRQWINSAVETFKGYGDKNIYHVNGLEILGDSDMDWVLEDQVHPSADGDRNISKRYSKLVMEEKFGLKRP